MFADIIKFIVEKFNSVLAFFKRLLGLSDVELTTYDNEAAKLETAISNKSDTIVEVPKEKNTPETAVTTRVKEVETSGKTLEKAKLFLSDLGNASKTGLFSDKKHLGLSLAVTVLLTMFSLNCIRENNLNVDFYAFVIIATASSTPVSSTTKSVRFAG